MAGPLLDISFKGGSDTRLVEGLRRKGPSIVEILQTKLTALMFQLQGYIVQQKLSGQVLSRRTGKLAASIRANPATLEGTSIVASVSGAGGPAFYGVVHEKGGLKAYEIMAVRARALAFVMNGQKVFAKSVLHPPALKRPFMQPSLDENAGNIEAQLRAAVNEEINR